MAVGFQVILHNCFKCGKDFQRFQRERVCPECRQPDRGKPTADLNLLGRSLTVREQQVVDLLERGLTDRLIAQELHLSPGTIGPYLDVIFQKVGVNSRVQLAVWSVKKRYGITD